MCITFPWGYKSTMREKEVGGGDSVGGCGVGIGGRQIKREDREEHLKEGMWIIRLCGIMYGHGCCQAEVSLGDSFGWPYILGTHTAGKPVKHVNEPYSVLDCGRLFTTTFSEKKNKLHHLAGVPPDFCQPVVYIYSQPNCVKPVYRYPCCYSTIPGGFYTLCYT